MLQVKTSTTLVRMAVATCKLISATPTFASTAVSPAKNAERSAQESQFMPRNLARGGSAADYMRRFAPRGPVLLRPARDRPAPLPAPANRTDNAGIRCRSNNRDGGGTAR